MARQLSDTTTQLKKSELYYIACDELQHIYRDYPEFNFTRRALTEDYYVMSEEKAGVLQMKCCNKMLPAGFNTDLVL